ncbi:hypothetical protein [Citrobacter braakii]|uniref:hypothetical protein n=1 Tax=Citrobacter braakii TaxID=57706 RepID=UPI001C7CD5CF|nr:hypothetical protein [Citrobacter braakii]MDV0580699.1 hypothetical protein [Citrobacter braakii]MEB0652402.1 hypothetical protein [Citrobacter braakii]
MNISDILTSTVYSNSVATIAIIVSLVAVPASGYLSYHYAIRGAKRKEWNDVAEPVLEYLEGHLAALARKRCPPDNNLNNFPEKKWAALLRRSSRRKVATFESALNDYKEILAIIDKSPAPMLCWGQSDSDVEPWIDRYPEGIATIEKLLQLLSLR